MAPARGSDEIRWYAPDPRAVLKLDEFHAPRRLVRSYRAQIYDLTIDKDFPAVIRACAETRDETWLNDELIELYIELHRTDYAHSIEAWHGGQLVGGLYGVTVPGRPIFCGESMFSRARDASKLCLVRLIQWLRARNFEYLDAQFQTGHLAQFNFREISQVQYNQLLQCEMAD